MSEDVPLKYCTLCQEWYPATNEFFRLKKRGKYGVGSQCKTCVNKKNKEYNSRPETQEKRRVYFERPEIHERRIAYFKAYNSSLKGHSRDYAHRSRPEIRERMREREKARYSRAEVRIQKLAYNKAYRNLPDIHERKRIANAHRYVRQKNIPGTYTPAQVQEQLKRQHYRCYYAACDFAKFQKAKGKYIFHVEHTFPLSRASGDDPINDISYLVLACPKCNLMKGDKFPHEFFEGGRLL